jgi:uncharacterized protein YjdB
MQKFKGGFSEMKTKKIVSLLLAVLMACSVFAGLSVSAEETTTHTYTVVGDAAFLNAGKDGWKVDDPAEDLTLQDDGTYAKTYENVASGNYNLKVAEDHAWTVSFGATVDSDANVGFNVPTDNSTVKVILTLAGTKEVTSEDGVTSTVTAGSVKVLVNGEDAPAPTTPDVTTHYVAGTIAPAGWSADAEANLMTLNNGVYEAEYTAVLAGTYEFKVTTNGAWEPAYSFQGTIAPGGDNETIVVAEDNSTVKITFNETEGFVRAYINGTEVEVERTTATTKAPETTDADNNTTAVTSKGGYYSPDPSTPSKRYFFEMPDSWKTFNNATACAYWWEGTDNCNDNADQITDKAEGEGGWQYSWIMKSAGVTGKNIYYIDVPADVTTIIFHNGIDGGTAPNEAEGIEASDNWGKNFQTINIGTECYDPGENPNYPDGVESFDNMVFVVNLDDKTVSDYSGATTYGGEWMYLHADGTEDYTAGTVWTDIPADEILATGITLNASSATLYVGGTKTLTATVTPKGATNKAVTWTSSKSSVATVDKNGKVTAKAQGTATITATTTDGTALTASAKITVKPRLVSSVKLNKTSLTLKKGQSATLKATVSPSNAAKKTVKWTTSNKSIATVSAKGVVKGVKAGSATVKATAQDGSKKSAQCKVKVTQPVTKVTIKLKNKTVKTATVKVKKTITLKATVSPSNATKKTVKWTTSSKKIATVSSKGVVKGVKAGKATIKATAQDGSKKAASVKVTVKKK